MPDAETSHSLALQIAGIAMLASVALSWVWASRRIRQGFPLLPPEPDEVVPWGGFSVLMVLLAWLFVTVAVGLAFARATGLHGPFSIRDQLLLVTLVNAATLALIPAVLRWTSVARLSDFGLARNQVVLDVVRGVVACLLLAPAVHAISIVSVKFWKPTLHPVEEMMRSDTSGGIALLAFATAVLFAPAAEELIFRGVIQGWLIRLFRGRPTEDPDPPSDPIEIEPEEEWTLVSVPDRPSVWDAPSTPLVMPRPAQAAPKPRRLLAWILPNLLTSAFFALVHYPQWPAPVPLFVLSLGLGALYQRTGSIVAPIAMHSTFNGISTIALFLSVYAGSPSPTQDPKPIPAVVAWQMGPEGPAYSTGARNVKIMSNTSVAGS